MIKVTVAIPVYNDDMFIERCINSILAQTLSQENIEIICIDDGSTDNTAKILDEYAQKHNNIRVEHQENSGSPSGPRNKAIEMASGKYIYFVDADDYLGEKALEKMVAIGETYNCDIVIGKYKGVNRGAPTAIFRRNPEFFQFFGSNAIYSISAVKMFKLSLLRKENIRFLESMNIGEDHAFTASAYIHSNGIGLVKDYDCYYQTRYQDSNRVQLTSQPKPFEKMYAFMEETLKVIASLNLEKEKVNKGLYHYWDRLLNFEIPNELNKKVSKVSMLQNVESLHALSLKYHPNESVNLFSPLQKIKFKLLEKGNVKDFIDFMKSDQLREDLIIHQKELYPANENAYKIALEEGIHLSTANKLYSHILSSYLVGNSLVLEGHQYQARISDSNPQLTLKITNRDSKEVYRMAAENKMLPENESLPLLKVPAGKERGNFFSAQIDLSFLRGTEEKVLFDFNLIADINGYVTEARLKTDENYFTENISLIKNPVIEEYYEIKPYQTSLSNFSLQIMNLKDLSRKLFIKESTFLFVQGELKCFFEIETKYLSLFREVEQARLIGNGLMLSASKICVLRDSNKILIYSDFIASKQEKKIISASENISLIIDEISLPIANFVELK